PFSRFSLFLALLSHCDLPSFPTRRSSDLLFFQVLPNCLSPLLVRLSLEFAHAILAESSLSFLGLGLPPPTASWGLMLKEVTPFLQLQPMAALFPGLTITLIILGFNLLGDGLRDIFDPRQYET